jgi:putative nucleotidyltransferase with HDIG domain
VRSVLFDDCPEPPDWRLDWEGLRARNPWLEPLALCPQDSIFHGEGDVLRHTRMVCEALCRHPDWRALEAEDREALFAAALLHDVGKPGRTIEEEGRIRAPRHSQIGARMARRILVELGRDRERALPFDLRERIVALVLHHGLPLTRLEDPSQLPWTLSASLALRCDHLALLSEADVLGRTADDLPELLERVELFRELCREQGCLNRPFEFASAHSRFLYFRDPTRSPLVERYDDTQVEVTLMSGLPGVGKDHWLATERPELPVVSLDDLRDLLGVSPVDDQAPVAAAAREAARDHLRARRDFAWNATNVTRRTRGLVIDLCARYRAKLQIVYVERPLDEVLADNRARDGAVPEGALLKLLDKLELPTLAEAHHVHYASW